MGLGGAVLVALSDPSLSWRSPQLFLGFATLGLATVLWAALILHALVAERLHPREWRRNLIAVARFFLGSRLG